MTTRLKTAIALCIVIGVTAVSLAQFRGRRSRTYGDDPLDRGNIPTWAVDEQFRGDLFTFVRIRYRSTYERQSLAWYTDYPDADLNLSFRLQQLTTLKVSPEPKVIEISNPELLDYPWAFMSGVGNIVLDDQEAEALRRYLLNGGFLMVDDFWGEANGRIFIAPSSKSFRIASPLICRAAIQSFIASMIYRTIVRCRRRTLALPSEIEAEELPGKWPTLVKCTFGRSSMTKNA